MALQLEIVSEHRSIVGDDAVRVFDGAGGTIGRSLQNDWILPDPDRYISGRHASIDFRGGMYYLVDTSRNGVYLNGDCEPIGKGNPRRLFNGDKLRLGDFEIEVSIDEGESIVMPIEDSDVRPFSHAASLVEEDISKTGVAMLEEDEITGDEDFQSTLFGGPIDSGITEVVQVSGDIEPEASQKIATNALAAADLVATDLLDTFLDGLGFSRAELHPSTDLSELMQNAGEALREFVEGTTELLASRANLKNAFRLDQTMALPKHNNPLKLSANARDSIKQLLVGEEGGYLGPRDSVHEVCRDLLFHQDAVLDAMHNAFSDFADRFDPDELEQYFDQTMGSNPLTKMFRKKRYWQLYRDRYPIMTDKGSGRLPQFCAEEFVAAYESQIAEYQALGGAKHLKKTVVLEQRESNSRLAGEPVNDEDFGPQDTENEVTRNQA